MADKSGLTHLTTPEEFQEWKAAVSGGQIFNLKLRYLKGSEKQGRAFGIDCRMWDILTPIPGYVYSKENGYPTLSLAGLKERGLIK